MTRSRMDAFALAAGALLIAALTGCATRTTVESLLRDPSRFDHKTVAIEGTVKGSIGAFGYGAYDVDDGTGTLTVVAKQGGAPREGTKVGVTGEFHSGFTLGSQIGVMLVEKDRQIR
jgi:hypothetical protein